MSIFFFLLDSETRWSYLFVCLAQCALLERLADIFTPTGRNLNQAPVEVSLTTSHHPPGWLGLGRVHAEQKVVRSTVAASIA